MRKLVVLGLSMVLAVSSLTGCAKKEAKSKDTISVVSREDGSGTRGAFVELTGVEEKDADGNKVDHTTDEAIVVNSTEIVMTTVESNNKAIGYVSLGSLNDTVKAVKVEGVEATADNIKSGSYSLSRPFNIVTKCEVNDCASDVINYILSDDGQKIITDNGYIEVPGTGSFVTTGVSGKLVIAGSSSVTPVMEKLVEGYKAVNPNLEIEVQESDSTTGVNAAIDGTCDIGMASRELTDSELGSGVESTVIANDGIAVIVNKENKIDNLSLDQVKQIFTGSVTSWGDVK